MESAPFSPTRSLVRSTTSERYVAGKPYLPVLGKGRDEPLPVSIPLGPAANSRSIESGANLDKLPLRGLKEIEYAI
jgi:hypothetical protein